MQFQPAQNLPADERQRLEIGLRQGHASAWEVAGQEARAPARGEGTDSGTGLGQPRPTDGRSEIEE